MGRSRRSGRRNGEKEKEAVKEHVTTITDHEQEEKVFRLQIKGDRMGERYTE